jgi:putative ABC transport system ATP-binding protein
MLLDARHLSKKYRRDAGTFFAVRDVSIAIPDGAYICITGMSGSGKSTLLNLITGLLRPDDGQIFIEGSDMAALSDVAQSRFRNGRIGYIPQGQSLLANFRVIDNILFPRSLYHRIDSDMVKRAHGLLERVGIGHLSDEYPQNLSGGEQRRVTIARGLINNPRLLVGDELTGDLDPETTDTVLRLLSEIRSNGTAVLLVTHETGQTRFADRHLRMDGGCLYEGET